MKLKVLAVSMSVVAVVAVLFIGLKIGGEMHYRNCLQRVEVEYPDAFQARGAITEGNPFTPKELLEPKPRFEFFQPPNRSIALSECHAWP